MAQPTLFFKLTPNAIQIVDKDAQELAVTNEQAIAIDAGHALCIYDTDTSSVKRIFVEADKQTRKGMVQGAEMTAEHTSLRLLPISPMKRPVVVSHCPLELEQYTDGYSFGIDIFKNARHYTHICVNYTGSEPTKRVPLYAYIHGSVTIMRNAICQWDSVQCGHMSVPADTDSATIDRYIKRINAYVQGDNFIVWADVDDDPEHDRGDVMFEGTQEECTEWCEQEDRKYTITY
jgi:hypothetical protein